jgi:hypothetical protein
MRCVSYYGETPRTEAERNPSFRSAPPTPMNDFPFGYEQIPPTTWFYLASLLTIGLYFKFNRAWSLRNLDLVLLILLGPGLLLQFHGHQMQQVAQRLAAGEAAVNVIEQGEPAGLPGESSPLEVHEGAIREGENQPAPENPREPVEDGSAATLFVPNDVETAGQTSTTPGEPAVANTNQAAEGAPNRHLAQFQRGRFIEILGFVWLFGIGALLMLRMLLDPMMTRRPMLEPNLSPGGLIFIGCALFLIMMANVVAGTPTEDDLTGAQGAEKILALDSSQEDAETSPSSRGPGYPWFHVVPNLATRAFVANDGSVPQQNREHLVNVLTAKVMAVLANLAIVVGIVLIGYRHFENVVMGIGAAVLFLMLPYTVEMAGRATHMLPAALLIWAVLCYRRPLTSGMFLGLAMGVFYYPFFLLPLWLSFYWQRGLMRFLTGVLMMLALTVMSLVFTASDWAQVWQSVQQMFGLWFARTSGLQGVWGLGWDPVFRLPVLSAFMVLSVSFAIWPAQKNLGTLMSCSAALMLATQFWHGFGDGGGMYIAWYLPLVLLTVFRPNLEDRVALAVLGEGWFPRRRRRTDARPFDDKKKDKAA